MTDREEVMVYRFDRDLEQILHNIVNEFNKNKDYKLRWNMNPKEQCFVNIKLSGNHLELRVEALKGGWRESNRFDMVEMQRFSKEVEDALKLAEKDLRKEFKERSGKAFRWSGETQVRSNYEPVALNALYKFYSTKSGPVSVKIDRQKHSENGPEINKAKNDTADDWKLTDILSLPEKWR